MTKPKGFDTLLFASVLLASALLFLLLAPRRQGGFAAVYVDGERVAVLDLSEDGRHELDGAAFPFVLTVERGAVRMTEADCPDGTCKKTGAVSRAGRAIVCLPNLVVVEVYGKREADAVAE